MLSYRPPMTVPGILPQLFAPRRHNMIRARVGNELPKMLVQIAPDEGRDVDGRSILTHQLALAGQGRRIDGFQFLLRMRETLVEVIDHGRFVRERAQLRLFFTAAEIFRLAAKPGRDE